MLWAAPGYFLDSHIAPCASKEYAETAGHGWFHIYHPQQAATP